jgi:hypothetical protein
MSDAVLPGSSGGGLGEAANSNCDPCLVVELYGVSTIIGRSWSSETCETCIDIVAA